MTEVRYPDITVKLVGEDGHAMAVLGKVKNALPHEVRAEFLDEATSGDYEHLLYTCMRWVNVT